jgi:hypothetical protein
LEGIRDHWNRTKTPIHQLEMFFELSDRTSSFITGPDLHVTWDELVNEALSETEKAAYYTTFPSLQDLWGMSMSAETDGMTPRR